jgi:hypothetical protein
MTFPAAVPAAARLRAGTRQQFLLRERLDHLIIRPGVEESVTVASIVAHSRLVSRIRRRSLPRTQNDRNVTTLS